MPTTIPMTSLAYVTGGAGDGWTDSMSNGCGNGHFNLPNETWRQACVDHDHRYFLGGSSADRRFADRQLARDMVAQGAPPIVAGAYYLGVRLGAGGRWGKVPENPGSH